MLFLWEIHAKKGHMIPMSFEVMRIFEDAGFKLKELIIKGATQLQSNGILENK